MKAAWALYGISGLTALAAALALADWVSIRPYERNADLRSAEAFARFSVAAGGALAAFFAGFVCQKLTEIVELMRDSTAGAASAPSRPFSHAPANKRPASATADDYLEGN